VTFFDRSEYRGVLQQPMANPRQPDALIYRFDDVVVDCGTFQVLKAGEPRTLAPRAFDLLVHLIENRDRVIEKQECFDQVWKDVFVSDNALTKAVKEVRRALGDDADSPHYIETVPKRGYRFIADLRPLDRIDQSAGKPPGIAAPDSVAGQQRYADGKPAATIPEKAPASGARARPGRALFAAAIVACLAAMVVLVIWRTRPSAVGREAVALRTRQITNWTGLDAFPALSPDGNSVAYSSDHGGKFEIYVRPLTPGARELQLTSDGQENFQPAWSPDGTLVAYHSKNRGGIWAVPASGGVARQLTEFGSRPAWSPDGSVIAFQSYPLTDLGATSVGALPPSILWTVAVQGGGLTPITQVGEPRGGHGAPAWSRDGKRLAFVSYDGASTNVCTISAGGGDLKTFTDGKRWVYDPVFSPDSTCIYYGGVSERGNFVLYKIRLSPKDGSALGEPVEIANTGLARIKNLTISTDGSKLAYCAPAMKGKIASVSPSDSSGQGALESGVGRTEPVALTRDASYRKGIIRFSPDGRKIAYVEFIGGTSQDIWVMDADGGNPTQLTSDPAVDWCPSWFPDSDRIAFQSDRGGRDMTWIVSLNSGRESLLLDAGQDVGWPVLSPDGKRLAFNSAKSGTINIWTVGVEGGPTEQLTFDEETMGWPSWSPDGKTIALQVKRGDDTHVMVMPAGGGSPTQLTFDRGQSWPYSWSPDGDKIAFAGFREGCWNVWWVSRSTKQQKRLTNYSGRSSYVRYPSWSPLGDRIVYEYAETAGNIWLMELK
jgi:Tol biopolymer transport system component/DNA-binding winged helix-turn-helix (wHTH) protein